jgi:hypothetical protein
LPAWYKTFTVDAVMHGRLDDEVFELSPPHEFKGFFCLFGG